MATSLFDVQAGCGGTPHAQTDAVGVDQLLSNLQRLDIAKALARTLPEDNIIDVLSANQELYADCDRHACLFPCPILVTSGNGDLPMEAEQVDEAIVHGAGAALLRPKADYWSLQPWASGPLLCAMEERRLPAYCLSEQFSFDEVGILAHQHPQLPIIVAGVEYRNDRTLLPLMRQFPNVYLSIGSNYTVHNGIERFVTSVGPERLLFGTGFPQVEPMGAVAMLMYAGISDEERQLVGSGNMERLIAEIQR